MFSCVVHMQVQSVERVIGRQNAHSYFSERNPAVSVTREKRKFIGYDFVKNITNVTKKVHKSHMY